MPLVKNMEHEFMEEFHGVCSFAIIFMENSWPMKETTFTSMSHEKYIPQFQGNFMAHEDDNLYFHES